ncbi:glycosyltransferase [Agromyces intestinalis]|uniref:Glycosyltransferase n=2 Tax=Agromyces intestinalis TaxID=2592652 RepID=A0A5C1YKS2_9MICO|nr:glycosyltransferase [Agromyces intestinalis]
MMPFYGRPDHLVAAVESVLAQRDDDWSLTVIDDVYPDPEPGRWVAGLSDPRITYLRNAENLGPSGNFRKSVDLMTASHGVIMGCDDVMLPGYVERVAELIRAFPDASVIQPGVEVIDLDGHVHSPIADRTKAAFRPGPGRHGASVVAGESLAASLLRATWTYFPSLVWRVEPLRRHPFRADLGIVQDLPVLLDLVADGGSFVIDREVVFQYRRHEASVSQANHDGTKFAEERLVYAEYGARFRSLGWHRAARAARTRLTSRLHAGRDLASASKSDPDRRRELARHVFGRGVE